MSATIRDFQKEPDSNMIQAEGLSQAEKISIVSKQYSRKGILLNSVRVLVLLVLVMIIAGGAVYVWQNQVQSDLERQYQGVIVKNTDSFQRAIQTLTAKHAKEIAERQERINYLGNQNIVLRKQRDQVRQDLLTIVQKKNDEIKDLEEFRSKVKNAEKESPQALSLLESSDRKYDTRNPDLSQQSETVRRLEFLKDNFPEYKSVR